MLAKSYFYKSCNVVYISPTLVSPYEIYDRHFPEQTVLNIVSRIYTQDTNISQKKLEPAWICVLKLTLPAIKTNTTFSPTYVYCFGDNEIFLFHSPVPKYLNLRLGLVTFWNAKITTLTEPTNCKCFLLLPWFRIQESLHISSFLLPGGYTRQLSEPLSFIVR